MLCVHKFERDYTVTLGGKIHVLSGDIPLIVLAKNKYILVVGLDCDSDLVFFGR